jgi:outer membrane immunogenic protein
MKSVFLASVGAFALAVLAGPAGAADLPPRYAAPMVTKAPAFAPVYNWTGFYIGINGGGGWGRSRWDTADGFNTSGWLAGGTAGYNWQVGQAVFGVEGDVDWANIKGSTNTLCPLGCNTQDSWLGTVRGRLGYAFDRFLPYITGGLAVGDIQASRPGFAGVTQTNAGWTAGGGIEFAAAGNWTLKAEYLYVDLGNVNCGFSCNTVFPTDNVTFKTNIFRGGVNYRF